MEKVESCRKESIRVEKESCMKKGGTGGWGRLGTSRKSTMYPVCQQQKLFKSNHTTNWVNIFSCSKLETHTVPDKYKIGHPSNSIRENNVTYLSVIFDKIIQLMYTVYPCYISTYPYIQPHNAAYQPLVIIHSPVQRLLMTFVLSGVRSQSVCEKSINASGNLLLITW